MGADGKERDMARVVHFEIPYDDAARASEFYASVFEWQLMPMPEMGYTIVSTGPTGEQGPTEAGFINGGLFQREEGFVGPNLVMDVDNLEDTLAAVEKAGGVTVKERMPVGEMGFVAYFKDTEGNLVGLWETAPQT
jgi:predicted enzyme related to lactoylglutathione lyase